MKPRKILLIEDGVRTEMTAASTLGSFGYEVVKVNKSEAVKKVLEDPEIDLALIDINPNSWQGDNQLAGEILQSRALPILFLTSHIDQEHIAKRSDGSVHHFILKDVDGSALKSSLEMALKLFEAEQKLIESEARYLSLSDHAPVGIFKTTMQGNITYVNDEWVKITGIGSQDVVGRNWAVFLHPDDHAGALAGWKGAARENRPFSLVFRYQHPQKTTRVKCLVGVENNVKGENIGYLGIITDISELKTDEETSFRSEIVHQILFNYSHDTILITTLDGRILAANPAACRMFSYTEEEFLKCGMAGLLDQSGPPLSTLFEKKVLSMVMKLIRKDGSHFSAEIMSVIDQDGKEGAYATLFIHDFTESQEAELALRESEERLRQIASTLRVGIWIRDVKTRQVLYVNPAFEELFGLSRETFYQEPDTFYNAIHPEDKKWLKKGDVTRSDEHRIVRPDGSIRWVWGRNFPVKNEAGEVYRMAAIIEDITERKLVEVEIQNQNEALETRVKERTQQLEMANQQMASLSFSMAHSVRTPLRALDGFSYLLLEEYGQTLDETGKDYLRRIRSASRRIWQVTDDLLELLSVTRGGLKVRQVDLSLMAQNIMRELLTSHPERQVDFICPQGLQVEADLEMTQVLLDNLLENAWKFTRDRPLARIELGSLDQDGQIVYFIRDNGVGFDMAYIDKLFGVFQRLHSPDAFEGSGVGLAKAQRIIQRHGGRIWAEGVVNNGAIFFFTFYQIK